MYLYRITEDKIGTWHSFYIIIHQTETTALIAQVSKEMLTEVTPHKQLKVRPTNAAVSSPFHIQVYDGNYSQENGTVHYYPAVLNEYIDTFK